MSPASWLRLEQSGALLLAGLLSAIIMRIIERGCVPALHAPLGWTALLLGICSGWCGFVRWKNASRMHGAWLLGCCAGIGGGGLFILTTQLF